VARASQIHVRRTWNGYSSLNRWFVGKAQSDNCQLSLLVACHPDSLDGFFLALAFGERHAGRVVLESPQRELEKPIGVRFAHPFVGVFEPFIAIGLRLFDEPANLIPAPYMESVRFAVLAGVIRATEIVDFYDIGQGLARPSAWGAAADASTIDGIAESFFQDCLVGLAFDRFGPGGKRVEIEQEFAVMDDTTARDVGSIS
jgi:hypothetical protein